MLDGVPNEIVIVRRKNSWDDESPIRGVWKIAYADFMTALMAFFLVMWLINVTDDSVRRGVAQYFNPVKLASTAPSRKGLNDPQINGDTNENGTKLFMGKLGGSDSPVDQDENFGDGLDAGHKAQEIEEKPLQGGVPATGQFTQIHSESILFSDPYAVLDTLSEKIRVAESLEDNPQGIGSGMRKSEGSLGGQAYRDPFDPLYWQFRPGRGVDGAELPQIPQGTGEADGTGTGKVDLEGENSRAAPFEEGSRFDERTAMNEHAPDLPAGSQNNAQVPENADRDETVAGELSETADKPTSIVAHVTGHVNDELENVQKFEVSAGDTALNEAPMADGEVTSETGILFARLSEVLENTEGTVLEETARQIELTREGEGTLISLTDDQNFGMFAIGSAEPRPELVKLLERIGKVVAETPGQIVVKGHTDARPFRSKTYDNWRLSSARAHMALYMLTRGGVAKQRFDRVEGYADRDLKNESDPLAASNRRIEIYLLQGEE